MSMRADACKCVRVTAGTRLNTSDDDNNPHTTAHNSHQFLCESYGPLEVVGVRYRVPPGAMPWPSEML